MKEPTGQQCEGNELMFEDEQSRYFACWYPQMGGYAGKAIVQIDKEPEPGDCFDCYIWHDKDFPFSGQEPLRMHHCRAEQFLGFGETVLGLLSRESPASYWDLRTSLERIASHPAYDRLEEQVNAGQLQESGDVGLFNVIVEAHAALFSTARARNGEAEALASILQICESTERRTMSFAKALENIKGHVEAALHHEKLGSRDADKETG